MHFNTAIAALMEATNTGTRLLGARPDDAPGIVDVAHRFLAQTVVSLVQPFAPHVASELWDVLGGSAVWAEPWPAFDESYVQRELVTVVVQVNGKLRGKVEVPADADEATVLAAARADAHVASLLEGTQSVRDIYVPGRLVNLVVRPG
jgi:leucyl-tRNA synthetase